MSEPSRFCAACTYALAQEPSPSQIETESRTHHGSPASLLHALSERCFICLTFWSNLSQTSRSWWTEPMSSDIDKYTTFRLYAEDYYEGIFRLSISFPSTIALMSSSNEMRFYLIAPDSDRQDNCTPLKIQCSTSSEATFDLVLKWYQTCRDEHERCCIPQKISGSWKPSRLIDIGSPNDANWKLCILAQRGSEDFSQEPYITLSYKWSSNANISLKTSNMKEFVQGCPINHLPQTFQDTIAVARKLSIRYVWIDALCIIQDSPSEWQHEAPKMRYVYANSTCNIAASAARDQFSGLFRTRNSECVLPAIFKTAGLLTWTIYDKHYWDRHIQTGVLHTRGWVFQECLLAPRVLYYGAHQVLWKCLAGVKCEGFPDGIPRHISHENLDILWDNLEDGPLSPHRHRAMRWSDEVHGLWESLVGKFLCCKLTYAGDRLLAFDGIAKLFKEVTGDDYIAGLWKSRILDQVHWMVPQPRARQMVSLDKYAPSWSWASIDGAVKPLGLPSISTNLVSLVNVRVPSTLGDGGEHYLCSILDLEGVLTRFRKAEDCSSKYLLGGKWFQGSVYPDRCELGKDNKGALFLLPLRTWKFMITQNERVTPVHVAGFVLQSAEGVYERCGYFETHARRDIGDLGLSVSSSQLAKTRRACLASRVRII